MLMMMMLRRMRLMKMMKRRELPRWKGQRETSER
jgi:hypothetical protein